LGASSLVEEDVPIPPTLQRPGPQSVDAPLSIADDVQVASPTALPAVAPSPTSSSTSRDARALATALASLPAPAPLAPSARRFLKPLVGVDSDTVRIHRGPGVSQIADHRNADALTVGDQVVLATGQDERSASALGVLAHELTHVARVREPRFVPPIVGKPTTSDEESVALDVEQAVRNSAQRERAAGQSIELPHAIPESVERPPRNTRRTTPTPATEPASVRTPPVRTPSLPAPRVPSDATADEPDTLPWGGLPAPWEPLPDVVTHMQSQTGEEGTALAGASESFASTAPVVEFTTAPAVQAAAQDRSVHEPAAADAATKPSGSGSSPAPDVDALARQVYDVLKRRLAAERRRGA